MNVAMNNCGGYHCVPDAVLGQMMDDLNSMGGMLGELIGLYEKESRLKKHHRAYLHVREYADKACKNYNEKMKEIAAHWKDQKVTCEDMGCKNPTDDPYVEDELKERVPNGTVEDVDVSKYPKGMVLMTVDSLGVMHDDVICLTEGLDTMVALLKAIIAGCPISKPEMEAVLHMTSNMSEEIFQRWEEAEIIELN